MKDCAAKSFCWGGGRWKVTKQRVGGSGCSWPRFCWSGDSISFRSSWTWCNMSLLPKALNSPTMSQAPTCCPVHTLLFYVIKTYQNCHLKTALYCQEPFTTLLPEHVFNCALFLSLGLQKLNWQDRKLRGAIKMRRWMDTMVMDGYSEDSWKFCSKNDSL